MTEKKRKKRKKRKRFYSCGVVLDEEES